MQKLPLKLLKPGMVLGRAVLNENGIPLISENTGLTDKLIARLENMKIAIVMVKGCPVKLEQYVPKSLSARLADLEIGFSLIEDDPLMKRFKVLVKAHFIKREQDMRQYNQDDGNHAIAAE